MATNYNELMNTQIIYKNNYLERFFKLNSASLMIDKKLFPNTKEITESFGAVNAVFNHLHIDRNETNVDIIVPGDGNTPRTGALFALLTAWNVISVDPLIRIKDYEIRRLSVIKEKAENVMYENTMKGEAVIVMVHSHADARKLLNNIKGYRKIHVIAIPCCFLTNLGIPTITYIDTGIKSKKNVVEVYKDLQFNSIDKAQVDFASEIQKIDSVTSEYDEIELKREELIEKLTKTKSKKTIRDLMLLYENSLNNDLK